ncbi:YvrJ protein family protein [Sporotomaculum syntrophicum]|uniref:YvrJ protein family protein n=1 Tax=Sporotomaculum syntrophicum TaxID=182264 RepID=A0A9D2WRD5_9FIRM|nr:YvrJ family protein [Sporotomaculum syntrophicum]KAF1086175.1 YvrJ protein family protein [Sporotomaculum syntrophicum]
MEEVMKLAANYGFPMVVAGYLLVRLEPLIRDLEKSITLLTMVVAKQSNIDVEQVQQIVEGGREMYRAQGRL